MTYSVPRVILCKQNVNKLNIYKLLFELFSTFEKNVSFKKMKDEQYLSSNLETIVVNRSSVKKLKSNYLIYAT